MLYVVYSVVLRDIELSSDTAVDCWTALLVLSLSLRHQNVGEAVQVLAAKYPWSSTLHCWEHSIHCTQGFTVFSQVSHCLTTLYFHQDFAPLFPADRLEKTMRVYYATFTLHIVTNVQLNRLHVVKYSWMFVNFTRLKSNWWTAIIVFGVMSIKLEPFSSFVVNEVYTFSDLSKNALFEKVKCKFCCTKFVTNLNYIFITC